MDATDVIDTRSVVRARPPLRPRLALWFLATTLLGCKFERTPSRPAGFSMNGVTAQPTSGSSAEVSPAVSDASVPIKTALGDAAQMFDASNMPQSPAGDAGSAGASGAAAAGAPSSPMQSSTADAGAPPDAGAADAEAAPPDAGPSVGILAGCTREELRERAEAYLQAMATGNTDMLKLHPALRYTENGQVQVLGAGLWLTRPLTDYARHVVDEKQCSSVTEAVLNDLQGRIVFGMRLSYTDDQLREVETHVVRNNLEYFEPDGVIPDGPDIWTQPVDSSARMTRDALRSLADRYFDVATGGATQPPSTPDCKRRQNGKLMPSDGRCDVSPGNSRFEERRYPVVDELNGVVTACVVYRGYIGIYLFKAAGDTIQDIDVVGGALANDSGW